MEAKKLHPAELDDEALHILREAEASINERLGGAANPAGEIFLVALNSKE